MGGGSWTAQSYTAYRSTTKACSMDKLNAASVYDIYEQRALIRHSLQ